MSVILVGNLTVTRGTTAQRTAITPDVGALIFDTDLRKVFVGDGTTVGGLDVGAAGATFIGLSDVPASYAGAAGKAVMVKATEDGLEFDTPAGSGDMLASTYDPAGIAQQVVGTTAAQALTHKDLTDPTNTFPATLAKDRSTVTALTNSAGTVNIDWSLGDYFTLTLAANVTSVTSSNLPASGVGRTICIDLVQDATGGRTFALPAAWKAIGNSDTAIQSAASAKTRIILSTTDGGTTKPYSMGKVAA